MISIKDMNHHLQVDCVNRFVDCKLECDMKIRLSDEHVHQTTECPNRIVQCSLKCVIDENVPKDERIIVTLPFKLLDVHLRFECPNRLLTHSLTHSLTYLLTYLLLQDHDMQRVP